MALARDAGPFALRSLSAGGLGSVGEIAVGDAEFRHLVPDAARVEDFTVVHGCGGATVLDASAALVSVGIEQPRATQSSGDARVIVVVEGATSNASRTRFLADLELLWTGCSGHQVIFGEVNDGRITERISGLSPVAVTGEIHCQAQFLAVSEDVALLLATAGSPGAIGRGKASRVGTVTITALAHADVASRMPEAAVDVAANTHTGELRALVGTLSTEEA